MENGPIHDDKLFRAINDRLSNYEAPQGGADWDAMSRSLDQLPKTTRMTFKWKPSLNSILIGVGIVAVSLLGLAFAGSGNGKESNTASTNIPVVQVKNTVTAPASTVPTVPAQNVVMNTTTNVNAPVAQNNASVPADNAAMTIVNHAATGSFHRHGSDADANGLRFGDQIDPRKGFIYHTQESNSLVGSHTDSIPSTYYDIVGGQHKTIHLNNDTAHHKAKANSDASTTATSNGAPTGQDITGFDMQLN